MCLLCSSDVMCVSDNIKCFQHLFLCIASKIPVLKAIQWTKTHSNKYTQHQVLCCLQSCTTLSEEWMWTVRSNNIPYLEYAADQWNGKSPKQFSFHSCNCWNMLLIQFSVQGKNAWRTNNIICKQLFLISYMPLTRKKIWKIKCLMGEKLSVLNVWITSDLYPGSISRNYFHHLESEKILLNTL